MCWNLLIKLQPGTKSLFNIYHYFRWIGKGEGDSCAWLASLCISDREEHLIKMTEAMDTGVSCTPLFFLLSAHYLLGWPEEPQENLLQHLLVPVQWMAGWMANQRGNDWPQNRNHITGANADFQCAIHCYLQISSMRQREYASAKLSFNKGVSDPVSTLWIFITWAWWTA